MTRWIFPYPCEECDPVIPSEGFLYVDSTVKPQRDSDGSQSSEEGVDGDDLDTTVRRCDRHFALY